MNVFNNKKVVFGIFAFLSCIVIALSVYLAYVINEQSECFCNPLESVITIDEEDNTDNKTIYVEVKGAVVAPGVYEMPENSIINDAITKAGGFNEDAYTDNINLSKRLSDELVIYVFSNSEYENNDESNNDIYKDNNDSDDTYYIDDFTSDNVSIITSDTESTGENATNNLININIATIEELMTLPGIGETKATNIINYRNDTGFFKTTEELMNVSGIGEATFEQLKDYITV